MGNTQPSSLFGIFIYHYIMIYLYKYINNVKEYEGVMPPSHSTLQNICHTYMACIWIKKWSCKIIQDVSPADERIENKNINNKPL